LEKKIVNSSLNRNISSSFDIIGDIAIIRSLHNNSISSDELEKYSQHILKFHKNVKTVLHQTSPIEGSFRLRKLQYVMGEKKTQTIHKEHNCQFSVDVEKCYFSPRLSYERWRVLKKILPNENIVNMFAGVGSFSVLIAKWIKSTKIYSIDINPSAIQFMKENIHLNRVFGKVIPIMGDSKIIIKKRLNGIADRVLMPLPEKAFEYLPLALLALKKSGGWIHFYAFEHAKKSENPTEKIKLKLAQKLNNLRINFDIPYSRIVRSVGPNWYQIVTDIKIMSILDRF
jgi:tRNA (guanine37-N1)-methyltransferase